VSETTEKFRLLALLEKNEAMMPKRHGREPFWRPKPPPAAAECHVPRWDWEAPILTPVGTPMVDLDVNAGYLSAASSVAVGHGALEHTKMRPHRSAGGKPNPGYYLVDAYYWGMYSAIISPLGDIEEGAQVWVTQPTLLLLDQLHEEGHWPTPGVLVHDSWTAEHSVRLRTWTTHLQEWRSVLIDQGKGPVYEDFKTAYSSAIAMMLTGDKCATRRPDWSHAIVAQHAANTWRKGWRSWQMGHGPIAMGDTDELTFTYDDYIALGAAAHDNPKTTPFRMDQSGKSLGSLKIKREYGYGDPEPEDTDA
jgi:hypothetical protein